MTLLGSFGFFYLQLAENYQQTIDESTIIFGVTLISLLILFWSWLCSYGPLGSRILGRGQNMPPDLERPESGLISDISQFSKNEASIHQGWPSDEHKKSSERSGTENQSLLRTKIKDLEAKVGELTSTNSQLSGEVKATLSLMAEKEDESLKLAEQLKTLESKLLISIEQQANEVARKMQLQTALEALESKYRSLLDGVSDSVFFTSSAGIIEYVSPATQDLFGIPAEDFLGSEINWAVDNDRDRLQTFLTQCQKKSTIVYAIKCRIEGKDQEKHVSHRINHLDIPGKRRIVIHSLSDVTLSILAEKQKSDYERQLVHASKLASLGTMGAGVAHELNNPITVIKGNMEHVRKELLATVGESHALVGMVDKVLKHVGRMRTIADQLRIFSRKEPKQEEWSVVSVERLIQDALELQRHLLSGSQIDLKVEISEPSPLLFVNPTNLESVIQNLVGNAYDAHLMRRGKYVERVDRPEASKVKPIEIEPSRPFIKIQVLATMNERVIIEFTDNAGGIPASVINQIFDPFFTTKEPGKGTGLGLALVQSIVTAHKGQVTCESKEGYGTVFRIDLPRAQPNITIQAKVGS